MTRQAIFMMCLSFIMIPMTYTVRIVVELINENNCIKIMINTMNMPTQLSYNRDETYSVVKYTVEDLIDRKRTHNFRMSKRALINAVRQQYQMASPTENNQNQQKASHNIQVQLMVLRFVKKLRVMSNTQNIYSQRSEALMVIDDSSMDISRYRKNKSPLQNLIKRSAEKKVKTKTWKRLKKHISQLWLSYLNHYFTLGTINPESSLIWYFNLMILFVTIIDFFFVTFQFCFQMDARTLQFCENYIVTPINFLLLVDLILKFNTGFILNGQLIRDRQRVTKLQIKSIKNDLISLIPLLIYNRDNRILNSVQLLFLLRIKNLSTLVEMLQSYHEIDSYYLYVWQLLKLTFMTVFGSHVIACFWFLLGQSNPDNSWVTKYVTDDSSLYQKYVLSLYWSVTTMLTVGYGDMVPVNEEEKLFTVFTMLIGCCVFGYVMSAIGMIFDQMNSQKSEIKKEMKKINVFLKTKKVDEDLKNRIRMYLNNQLSKLEMKHLLYSSQFIPMLSLQLKTQLIHQQFNPFLQKDLLVQTFSQKIWTQFTPAINEKYFMPDDVIEGGNNWYFVLSGELVWRLTRERTDIQKVQNSFGEWSFFSGLRQNYGVYVAKSFCTVLMIERDKFIKFLKNSSTRDHQQFCMMQDEINFNQNFKVLGQTCSICFQSSHNIFKCHQTHFNLRPEKLYRQNQLINNRSFVHRGFHKTWKTKSYLTHLQANVIVFLEDNQQNEKFMRIVASMGKISLQDVEEEEDDEESLPLSKIFSSGDELKISSSKSISDQEIYSPPKLTINFEEVRSNHPRKGIMREVLSRNTLEDVLAIKNPHRNPGICLHTDDVKIKFAQLVSTDQLNDVRKKHSTIKLNSEESLDSTPTEQFFEMEDFDKGTDFDVYFPDFNMSNIAPPKCLVRRSSPATFINIKTSDQVI